jgi:hypothetical protein
MKAGRQPPNPQEYHRPRLEDSVSQQQQYDGSRDWEVEMKGLGEPLDKEGFLAAIDPWLQHHLHGGAPPVGITRFEFDPEENTSSTVDAAPPSIRHRLRAVLQRQREAPAASAGVSLGQHLDWSRRHTPDPFYEAVAAHGFKPELLRGFEQEVVHVDNASSCFESDENSSFVSQSVLQLLITGAAKPVGYLSSAWVGGPLGFAKPRVVLPLSVKAKKGRKKHRLVTDASIKRRRGGETVLLGPNGGMPDISFVCDSLAQDGRSVFLFGTKTWSLDLAAGYHAVPLASGEDGSGLFGFTWMGVLFVYTVLPFGCKPSARIFTRMLAPLVKKWRLQGIPFLQYIDDLNGANFGTLPEEDVVTVVEDLHAAGWIIAFDKCCFSMPQVAEPTLGIRIDTGGYYRGQATGLYLATAATKAKLLSRCQRLLGGTPHDHQRKRRRGDLRVRALELASLAGLVSSMILVVGPIARVRCRAIWRALAPVYKAVDNGEHNAWQRWIALDDGARAALRWFENAVDDPSSPISTGTPITPYDIQIACKFRITFDAGGGFWGGTLQWPRSDPQRFLNDDGELILEGRATFTMDERAESSAWREGTALERFVEALPQYVDGHIITATSDAAALVFAMGGKVEGFDGVYGGANSPRLQEVIERVHNLLEKRHITLDLVWVPRERNTFADFLSKLVDRNDFMLAQRWFKFACTRWGTPGIDLFASDTNALLPRFVARWWCPGCYEVDALRLDWSRWFSWVNPPFLLLGVVFRRLMACKAAAIVVAPFWPSRPWWPVLVPDGQHWHPNIVDVVEIPEARFTRDVFLPGATANEVALLAPRFRTFLLMVDFTVNNPSRSRWFNQSALRCVAEFRCSGCRR